MFFPCHLLWDALIKENVTKLKKNILYNAPDRKRKVDSECRTFRELWTDEYFCVSMNGEAWRLICCENIIFLIITQLSITIKSTRYKHFVAALRIVIQKKQEFSHNRMSSGNRPMEVLLHCMQAIVLLTRWLKQTF
jgi:hypothetical protein